MVIALTGPVWPSKSYLNWRFSYFQSLITPSHPAVIMSGDFDYGVNLT
jgi:hypothetical protein